MQDLDLFSLYCRKFAALRIPYMVTGSVAAILYGEPRLTNDIDIVAFLSRFEAETFAAAFPPDDFYCPPVEILIIESRRAQRGHFNLIHHESGFKADIYVATDDPFYQWALENSRSIDVETGTIQVAPAEYVLINKLRYYKEGGSAKHIGDIKGMVEHSSELINWQIVEAEAERQGLQKELTEIRQLAPCL